MNKLIKFLVVVGIAAAVAFGQTWDAGANVKATLSDGVLTISGGGVMQDYNRQPPPWNSVKNSITSVSIGNGVTTIGASAFAYCDRLTSVTIPNSVMSIGADTFRSSGLTSIDIPNGVKSIGADAFNSCSVLTSVTIPNSVTTIGSQAFRSSGLTSIDIPNGVTTIGRRAFAFCKGLTSVTLPNSVTSIGAETFQGSGLTSIDIPNSVTSIGEWAFSLCYELTSVTIGNSVTSIGNQAFSSCNKITSIISLAPTPPKVGILAFDYRIFNQTSLYVPEGSVDAYKANSGWSRFKNITDETPPTTTSISKIGNKKSAAFAFAGINNGQINLQLQAGNYTAELYDLRGRIISKVEINAINGINATGLRTDKLAKGMFILNVRQKGVSVLRHKISVR